MKLLTTAQNYTYTIQAYQSQIICYQPKKSGKGQLHIELEEAASCDIQLLLQDGNHELELRIILKGKNAQARIRGLYRLDNKETVRISTHQIHDAAHTQSDLLIKGVLDGSSHAHYHGKIYVGSDAHNTQANQQNKNLLVSSHAHAESVPSLEVLTDEVQCAHGSAIGYLDCEQLYYVQSRGIELNQAEQMLIEAFCAEVV